MKKLARLTIPISLLLFSAGVAAKDVIVCWSPPTLNTDGSVLTDLRGFRVEWGKGKIDKSFTINRPDAKCQKLPGLEAGTWLVRVVALAASNESDPSVTVTQIIIPPATQGSIESAGKDRIIPPRPKK